MEGLAQAIALWKVQECSKRTPNVKVKAFFTVWLMQLAKERRYDLRCTLEGLPHAIALWKVQERHKRTHNVKVLAVFTDWLMQ